MGANSYVCTAFHCDSKEEANRYPQVGDDSSNPKFQLVYWRCVVTFFATSIRNNANSQHIFFTNEREIPDIGGFETARFFEENEIEVVTLPYTCKIPRNNFNCWGSTFYIFDILKHISENAVEDDIYIILDPDCVFINPVDRLVDLISRYDVLTYDLRSPPEVDLYGLSRLDMKEIYEEINGRALSEPPRDYGAEWVGAKVKVIKDIVRIFDETRSIIDERVKRGKKSFNTEEHLLNYIYQKLEYPLKPVNPYLRRLLTAPNVNNIKGDEFSLDIWHMPAEKLTGIKALFDEVADPESIFCKIRSRERFAEYLGHRLSIFRISRENNLGKLPLLGARST